MKPFTNRDLYLAICELREKYRDTSPSLESYLLAHWRLARVHRDRSSLEIHEFLGLLASAFTAEAPEFDESWRTRVFQEDGLTGFHAFEETILAQIVDLRMLREAGKLESEFLYFGVDSPGRRGCWYNFDPGGFLEAATQGSAGGWQPGDDGRESLSGGEPEEPDTFEIREITWEEFADFLWYGQEYE